MDTTIDFLERKKRVKKLKTEDSDSHWGARVFVIACLLLGLGTLVWGDGTSPNFQRAGQVLTDGLWQLLELAAGVGVCIWILCMTFKTASAPKNKRE